MRRICTGRHPFRKIVEPALCLSQPLVHKRPSTSPLTNTHLSSIALLFHDDGQICSIEIAPTGEFVCTERVRGIQLCESSGRHHPSSDSKVSKAEY